MMRWREWGFFGVAEESGLLLIFFDRSTDSGVVDVFLSPSIFRRARLFHFSIRLISVSSLAPPTAARTMSSHHGEGDGGRESASQSDELVPSAPSSSLSSSSSIAPSRPRLLPPSLPHLHFSLPSPRGIALAIAGTGDAARHQAHLALRTADFWRRATGIYLAYKGRQAQEAALTSRARALLAPLLPGGSRPWDKERLEEELWKPHHEWAGKEMYELAVSVRGFYLKVSRCGGLRF